MQLDRLERSIDSFYYSCYVIVTTRKIREPSKFFGLGKRDNNKETADLVVSNFIMVYFGNYTYFWQVRLLLTKLRLLWTTTFTLETTFNLDKYVHFGQVHSLWTNYVYYGQVRLLRTTTFTLDNYVYFRQVRLLLTSTFTFDKYVHFGKVSLLWTRTFTLDKYVYRQVRLLWTSTFVLDIYIHFKQQR